MKKLVLFFMLLGSFFVVSDDHVKVMPGGEVGEFHYFDVMNPAAFVGAMDAFNVSDCAQKWHSESGAKVALMSILGSGWTHFIYVGYEDLAKMEMGRNLLNCPAFFSMLVALRESSNEEAYLSQVGPLSLQLRDWTQDPYFMKFDLRVKPGSESEYAAAWTKYVEANSSVAKGSAGLVSMLGGTGYSSHMAFVGGSSMAEIVSSLQEIQSSEAHAEFIGSVGDIRDIRNQMFVQPLKSYQ